MPIRRSPVRARYAIVGTKEGPPMTRDDITERQLSLLQYVAGGAAGAGVMFIARLLSVPSLTPLLAAALVSLAAALPLLVGTIIAAINHSARCEPIVNARLFLAMYMIGILLVFLGVLFIIWHLWWVAGVEFLLGIVLAALCTCAPVLRVQPNAQPQPSEGDEVPDR